jgi:selenide,water dikinase
VQGLVDPCRVFTKAGARPGDVLVLSKPIGTGIVLAGSGAAEKQAAIATMRMLNRAASEVLSGVGNDLVHAVTDVTGFGLCGHGWEMAERSGVRFSFDTAQLPLYAGALEAAEAGTRTGGDARNREHLAAHVTVGGGVGAALEALCFDPQTSGGLLAAIDPWAVNATTDAGFTVVGSVAAGAAGIDLV